MPKAAYSGTTGWKTRYPAADSNTTFVTKVFTNAGVPAARLAELDRQLRDRFRDYEFQTVIALRAAG